MTRTRTRTMMRNRLSAKHRGERRGHDAREIAGELQDLGVNREIRHHQRGPMVQRAAPRYFVDCLSRDVWHNTLPTRARACAQTVPTACCSGTRECCIWESNCNCLVASLPPLSAVNCEESPPPPCSLAAFDTVPARDVSRPGGARGVPRAGANDEGPYCCAFDF